MDECIAIATEEQCNCTMYYMPNEFYFKHCTPSTYSCTDKVRKDVVENGISESCSESECLPTCTEIKYRKEVTFLSLQEKKLQRMFTAESSKKSNLESYLASNVSIVHVYFSENSVHPKLRKEVTSLIGLLSNAGGLLGLCMGFSVLSLLEIVYYGSLRVFCSVYRNKVLHNQSMETNPVNVISQNDFFHSRSPIIHSK